MLEKEYPWVDFNDIPFGKKLELELENWNLRTET